jgi:hypothetical protein
MSIMPHLIDLVANLAMFRLEVNIQEHNLQV